MHVAPPPSGTYQAFRVCEETGAWDPVSAARRRNQIQLDWARIALQCIGLGNPAYRVSTVYVEFVNVGSPGEAASVPAFDRGEGVSYYTSLSGGRDYLRLPLLSSPRLGVAAGSEADFSGAGDDFNEMTFFAQTAGAFGVRGLSFADASNSVAVGIALAAAPVPADFTRDVVFGRAYFAPGEQVPKAASHQIGVSWSQTFG